MDRLIRDADQQNLRGIGGNVGFPQNIQAPPNVPNQQGANNATGKFLRHKVEVMRVEGFISIESIFSNYAF